MRWSINQGADAPAQLGKVGNHAVTYLYDRSRDSKNSNTPGQDFITLAQDTMYAGRLAFAVCDGVSQSFYGDIAAKLLGESLVDWLITSEIDPENFPGQVGAQLQNWIQPASALVAAKVIPETVPPLVRSALDLKRANGSESMFVAGLIDPVNDYLALTWMGDLRCLVFDGQNREIPIPDAIWETRERWSTRLGAKNGSPHAVILPLTGIARIVAHTDGVGSRGVELRSTITINSLNKLAAELNAAAASDDVSILDIRLNAGESLAELPPAPEQSKPTQSVGSVAPVPEPPMEVPTPANPILQTSAEATVSLRASPSTSEFPFRSGLIMGLSLVLALLLAVGGFFVIIGR